MNQPLSPDLGLSPKRPLLAVVGVAALTAVLLFFHLASYTVMRTREAYVAVPAQEMLATGNWLIPYYEAVPRLEKPPLLYWTVAAMGWLSGGINEWTVRLPSAVSAFLLIALVGFWATRWYGRFVGLCAAFIQATSGYLLNWGRVGVVDIPLTLLIVASVYLGANFCCPQLSALRQSGGDSTGKTFFRWIVIYAILGVSALAKPGLGIILGIIPCGVFLALQGRMRDLLQLVNPIGIAIAATMTFIWPYFAGKEMPEVWRILYQETIGRAGGTTPYQDPFWFYAVGVPINILPWTPLILVEIPQSWRRAWKGRDPREQFMWVWFLTSVLVLSLSVGKSDRYILPALTALVFIASHRLARLLYLLQDGVRTAIKWPMWISGTMIAIAIIAGTGLIHPSLPSAISTFSVVTLFLFGAGFSVVTWLWSAGRRYLAVHAALLVLVAVYMSAMVWVFPHYDQNRPAVEFAQNAAASVPRNGEIVAYRLGHKSSILFYLQDRVVPAANPTVVAQRLAQKGLIHVLCRRDSRGQLEKLGELLILREMEPVNNFQQGDPKRLIFARLILQQ